MPAPCRPEALELKQYRLRLYLTKKERNSHALFLNGANRPGNQVNKTPEVVFPQFNRGTNTYRRS